MAVSREGARLARALRQRLSAQQSAPLCARGFASTRPAHNATVKDDGIADIESTSAFTAPQPDQNIVKAFEEARSRDHKERRLPGNRYVLPLEARRREASLTRTPDTNTTLPSIIEALCILSRRRPHPTRRLATSFLGHLAFPG